MKGTILNTEDARGFCFILSDGGGPEIFALRKEFENPQVSLHDAAGLRVEFDLGDEGRAESVKFIDDPAGREFGTIERVIERGAFIEPFQLRGIYFHSSQLVGDNWPTNLRGVPVSYTIRQDAKGRPVAAAVRQES